jgi:hypothetical protein
VIPVPEKITFGMATLLTAACCIPAVLSLGIMWNKFLEIKWKRHLDGGDKDKPIEGTSGADTAQT